MQPYEVRAGVGWASESGVLLPYVSAGRRRRFLEGLDIVNLSGHRFE